MKRNISLDLLKLIMACMVVGLHAGFLREYSKLAEYLFVNGVFRIAVPIFFIINGFYFYSTLLNKTKKIWFKRVCFLYVIWMAFYSPIWAGLASENTSILGLIGIFIIGYHHLWYLSGVLGAAILTVIFRKVEDMLVILIILGTFLIGVLIQYAGNYHLFENTTADRVLNTDWVHRNFIFLAFPFFCIGFLINKRSLHKKISIKTTSISALIGAIFLITESYVNYYMPSRDGGFDNYIALILVCPFIFMYFQQKQISGKTKSVGLYSSAVYFIHPFTLILLKKFTHFENTLLTLIGIIVSVLISYFIIRLNYKIKVIL